MGLVLKNIKKDNVLDDISLKINEKKIIGLYGDNVNIIMDIINGDIDYKGEIIYNKDIIDKDFYKKNPTKIALIDSIPHFYSTSVSDEIRFNLAFRGHEIKSLEKEEKKLFDNLGLDKKLLDRRIETLSFSEKYLLSIVINTIYNPDIIMFKNIFSGIDYNSKKRLKTLLNNLKEENKIVIVSSNDPDVLYDITDEIIILKDKTIYKKGATEKVLTSNELMKEGSVLMPSLSKVIYLAKTNKKVKLTYQKDVRDVIKDIYKHV